MEYKEYQETDPGTQENEPETHKGLTEEERARIEERLDRQMIAARERKYEEVHRRLMPYDNSYSSSSRSGDLVSCLIFSWAAAVCHMVMFFVRLSNVTHKVRFGFFGGAFWLFPVGILFFILAAPSTKRFSHTGSPVSVVIAKTFKWIGLGLAIFALTVLGIIG